jgi:putative SOS response-associated peptidase YedK
MGELHDRMPVILGENDWPKWLGEEAASEQELLALLKTMPGRGTENLAGR